MVNVKYDDMVDEARSFERAYYVVTIREARQVAIGALEQLHKTRHISLAVTSECSFAVFVKGAWTGLLTLIERQVE